jgi:hypothetical protein
MPNPHFRILASALLLSACAAPNPYRPFEGGQGYTETVVAQDRWQIAYHGTADQDEVTAKKYAIVRAAEIAKRDGFPGFRVEDGKTREKQERDVIRESVAVRDDPYPGRYWGSRRVRQRTVTHTEKRPVVKITVVMEKENCDQCLGTDAILADAAGSGILDR